MTPLGLHHLMATRPPLRSRARGSKAVRARTGPRSITTAPTREGIGFDRTRARQQCGRAICAAGRARVRRSAARAGRIPALVPPCAVGLPARARAGRLWDELVHRYTRGVGYVRGMRSTWNGLAGRSRRRAPRAGRRLPRASRRRKRNGGATPASPISRRFSGRPLPAGAAPPAHSLDYYEVAGVSVRAGRRAMSCARGSQRRHRSCDCSVCCWRYRCCFVSTAASARSSGRCAVAACHVPGPRGAATRPADPGLGPCASRARRCAVALAGKQRARARRWRGTMGSAAAAVESRRAAYPDRDRGVRHANHRATCWSATCGCVRASRTWSCRSGARSMHAPRSPVRPATTIRLLTVPQTGSVVPLETFPGLRAMANR